MKTKNPIHFPLIFSVMLLLTVFRGGAQDTLELRSGKLACKVIRISETELEYKKWTHLDGPVHVVSTNQVYSIRYQNGTMEHYKNGKVSTVATGSETSQQGRHAIKFDLFSPAFHKITLGYEFALNQNIGFELHSSFASSRILPRYTNNYIIQPHTQGLALRLGTKFWFDHNPGMNNQQLNGHIGGFFMRLDLMYAQQALTNVVYGNYYNWIYPYPYIRRLCSVNNIQMGMSMAIGCQTLIGQHILLQFNCGFGYLYSKAIVKEGPEADYNVSYANYWDGYSFNPYGPAINIENGAFCITGNCAIGYLFGGKKSKDKK